jgi:CDP-diacylglycerol--glycerol-3-phosphate 3-phosphatidyltransferase
VRITANQVTLARLFLLPVPMAMVYTETFGWMLAALVLFALLGLTDAVDGMLARRHGATPLGALLDPIVDKIFLVATFGPLTDLRIVAPWLGLVLFVRELAVTALRSVALEERATFRTSRIAKLKTTVQMAGAGFIFLVHVFPRDRIVVPILAFAAACSLAVPLIQWARGRTPGWRAWSGAVLITGVAICRLLTDRDTAIMGFTVTIAVFTVVSGAEYFWSLRGVLARRFGRRPLELLRLAGLSLAVPLGFLPAMQIDGAPIYAILLILAVELALGGVDNSLIQAGRVRGPGADLARSVSQAAAGAVMTWSLTVGPGVVVAHVAANAALVVSLADLAVRLRRHREAFG